jgi:hypothetical protein
MHEGCKTLVTAINRRLPHAASIVMECDPIAVRGRRTGGNAPRGGARKILDW